MLVHGVVGQNCEIRLIFTGSILRTNLKFRKLNYRKHLADPLCTSLKLWNVKDDGQEQITI